MSFPRGFLFGAASSAYQIEGAWNEDGKGLNMWDQYTHSNCLPNGNVACDSYHKYKEDIFLIKDIGFDVYRFSISWARILPTGDITDINGAGIKYYKRFIDELLDNGIEPMVTIYHWDMPQRLQDIGGWTNPLIVDYIEDYANVLFEHLGNKVKWWISINEPLQIIWGYESKRFAPALNLDSPANYVVAHNILRAHGRIYRLYEKKYKVLQQGKISIALSGDSCLPKTDSTADVEAANRANIFTFGWFSDPIYSKNGDYPEIMRQTIDENSKTEGRNRSRLPTFSSDEIMMIKGSFDFFALNHYTSRLCSPGDNSTRYSTTYDKDVNVKREIDPLWPKTASESFQVYPEGLRKVLIWIKNQYDNVPVYITENGYCDYEKKHLDDPERESYHNKFLEQVLLAIEEDGCDVIGYTVWSLLDDYEWFSGYKLRFGIVYVDFEDPERKRTQKGSASFFKELLKQRTLPEIQMEVESYRVNRNN